MEQYGTVSEKMSICMSEASLINVGNYQASYNLPFSLDIEQRRLDGSSQMHP